MDDPDDRPQPMSQLSAHLDRGWDLVARGDLAGAGLSADKAVELADDSPDARNLLGYVLAAQGRVEDALEQYQVALELDEGHVDAMLNLAELSLYALRDTERALEMAREARAWLHEDELDQHADAILLEIEIHLERNDAEAARKTAAELPTGPFENAQLQLSVARAMVDVGEHERARPLLEAATAAGGPQHADAHYYLGVVHEKSGDGRAALLSFLRSRELDLLSPRHPAALPQPHFEQRVQTALSRLSPDVARPLEGALVVVTDLPGAEIVAEGIDPRAPLLLDGLPPPGSDQPPRITRVFIYRRNVERVAIGLLDVDVEVARTLDEEIRAAFPELNRPTDTPEA